MKDKEKLEKAIAEMMERMHAADTLSLSVSIALENTTKDGDRTVLRSETLRLTDAKVMNDTVLQLFHRMFDKMVEQVRAAYPAVLSIK